MSIEETMEAHGFRLSAGCSGEASYTKFFQSHGKRAYINITNSAGDGFPASLDDPVKVVVYDLKSGDELDPGQSFPSLCAYLDSIGK